MKTLKAVALVTSFFVLAVAGFKVVNAQTVQPHISNINPTSAGDGQSVTVYGSNLYGDGIVWDGTDLSTSMTSYSFADTSGNNLTFTVPANAAAGQHTIQIEQRIIGGLSNSATLTVVPAITYINPSTAKVGDSVTIYGTNLYGNIIIFDGQNSGIIPTFPDTSGTSMSFVVPSSWSVGTHTIQIEQRIIGGTSSAATFTVAAPTPLATFTSFSASPTSISSGQMTTISYSGTNLSTVTMTVTCPSGMSSPDGHGGDACGRTSTFASGVMSTQLQLSNTTASNQQVTIAISAHDASNSLVGTKYAYVTVAPASQATFTSFSASPTSISSGQMTTVNFSGTNLLEVHMMVNCPSGVSAPDSHGSDGCTQHIFYPLQPGVNTAQFQFNNTTGNSQQVQFVLTGYDMSDTPIAQTESGYVTVNPTTASPVTPITTSPPAPTTTTPIVPTTPITTTPPTNNPSIQALQQQLIQLITLLLQLLEKAAAQGLLTSGQLNSALNAIQH